MPAHVAVLRAAAVLVLLGLAMLPLTGPGYLVIATGATLAVAGPVLRTARR
ncbi:PGPGW domain-containing protein [Kineosporia succinea]|uniref:Uncharacterized protein n=1 Tax=Kineosporia succinea TaxID=84632 RepID=A0ABT9PB25_9ACTN|nr:PGPGW domain-containing protein [Kineosporia succinea]MDP9829896.1 hypothetical protein [Kineosporia succinea]